RQVTQRFELFRKLPFILDQPLELLAYCGRRLDEHTPLVAVDQKLAIIQLRERYAADIHHGRNAQRAREDRRVRKGRAARAHDSGKLLDRYVRDPSDADLLADQHAPLWILSRRRVARLQPKQPAATQTANIVRARSQIRIVHLSEDPGL